VTMDRKEARSRCCIYIWTL